MKGRVGGMGGEGGVSFYCIGRNDRRTIKVFVDGCLS